MSRFTTESTIWTSSCALSGAALLDPGLSLQAFRSPGVSCCAKGSSCSVRLLSYLCRTGLTQ